MRFETSLVLFLTSLFLLAVVHQLGMAFAFYYRFFWFDIVMHFWGGTLIGLGSQTELFRKVSHLSPRTLGETLVVVLIVGLVWEVFEWYAGISVVVELYNSAIDNYRDIFIFDTAKDLIFDVVGGGVGFWMARRFSTDLDTHE